MKCEVCGKRYSEQDLICPHCGNNLIEQDLKKGNLIDALPEIHDELNLIQENRELRARRKKLRFRIMVAVLIVIFCVSAGFCAMYFFKNYGKPAQDASTEKTLRPSGVAGETVKKFLGEGFTSVQIVDEASALSAIESVLPEFGSVVDNVSYQLDEHITINGDSYYRFQQTVEGIPVIGGEMIVFADGAGKPLALNGRFVETSGLDLTAKLDSASGANAVNSYINKLSRENRITEGANITPVELVICNYDGNTFLAYTANASGYSEKGTYVAFDVFVDADQGAGIFLSHTASFENEADETAEAPVDAEPEETKKPAIKTGAVALYMVNDKFNWNDTKKPSSVELIDVSGEVSKYVENANIAVNKAYNYFATKHNWRGLDGKNTPVKVYLNTNDYVPDRLPIERAQFANDALMFVQDTEAGELLSENVVAHEYAHGVMYHIAKLSGTDAANENAVIAESLADIFAELTEGNKPDWVHGVRDFTAPAAGYHTTLPQQVHVTKTEDCYFYGTILSHAAYEMYANGIGPEKLGQLHFRTLCLLNSSSGFSDYRSAMELSAHRMNTAGILSDVQLSIVIDALDRANVTGPRLYNAEIATITDEIEEGEMLPDNEEDPNEIIIE